MNHVVLTNPCGITGDIVKQSLESHGLRVGVMTGPNARKMEPAYIRTLMKLTMDMEAGMIIPVFFPEILSAHRNEFARFIIPVETPEKLMLLDNKRRACELALSLGIPQPRLYGTVSEVRDYPAVFKRALGQGGDSVYFPGNRKALDNLVRSGGEYLISEFIQGDNVCVDCLRWDNWWFASAYRVLEPSGKGVSTLRVSIDNPRACSLCRMMLDAVDFHGVCSMDFRQDASGQLYFLECNPRFSGGLESAIASGFDIPWLYYQLASGNIPDVGEIDMKYGIITGRSLINQKE